MTNTLIEAASAEDIPRMAQIHVMAFSGDALVALMFKEKTKLELKVRQMLTEQIASSEWTVLKATDLDKGEMTSWATWRKLYGSLSNHGDREEAKIQPGDQTREGRSDPAALSNYIGSEFRRWMAPWTKRKEYLICDTLVTDPQWQGRGFASSLVQRGNYLADAWKLPILAQASPYSYRIFKDRGLEIVRCLDVDLREWIPGASTNDKGYGVYRIRYMLRLPEKDVQIRHQTHAQDGDI